MKRMLALVAVMNIFLSHAAAEQATLERLPKEEQFIHEMLQGDVVQGEKPHQVQKYNVAKIECLLDAGVDPNTLVDGQYPLWRAMRHSWPTSAKLVMLLLRKGAQMSVIDNDSFAKALRPWIDYADKEIKMFALIDAGFKIDTDTIVCRLASDRCNNGHDKWWHDEWQACGRDLERLALESALGYLLKPDKRLILRIQERIAEKRAEGTQLHALLPGIIQAFLPVRDRVKGPVMLADLVGQYAHPYYDYQEPEQTAGNGQGGPTSR